VSGRDAGCSRSPMPGVLPAGGAGTSVALLEFRVQMMCDGASYSHWVLQVNFFSCTHGMAPLPHTPYVKIAESCPTAYSEYGIPNFAWINHERTRILPLKSVLLLYNRHIGTTGGCPNCYQGPEDISHLLFQCETARDLCENLGIADIAGG
jgi:hypothetical protein